MTDYITLSKGGVAHFDDDGRQVIAGDVIRFSFGMPGTRVEAKIQDVGGTLYAMTPDHNPKKCKLEDLRRHVGGFWKIRGTV